MDVVFTPTAWEQYLEWQEEDRNLIIYSCKYHYEE